MSRMNESAFFSRQERSINGRARDLKQLLLGEEPAGRAINPFAARLEKIPVAVHSGRWLHLICPNTDQEVRTVLDHSVQGGRWSPPHSFPVIYTTENDPATRRYLMRWIQEEDRADLIVVCIHVRLGRVLDLVDPAIRGALDTTFQEMCDPADWGLSQAIGVAAHRAGFQGILYPRPPEGIYRNLALFPDRVAETELNPGDFL